MNVTAARGRRKMQKALQSMPTTAHPHHQLTLKVHTEQVPKDTSQEGKLLTIADHRERGEDVLRAAKRFYRYRPNVLMR